MYLLIRGFAFFGMMAYFLISDLFFGTSVKILPESKSRSLMRINSRMAFSELRGAAYPSTVSVGIVITFSLTRLNRILVSSTSNP